MADGENRRMIDMVEVVDNFFKPEKTIGDIMDDVAIEREKKLLMLRLSDFDIKLRELSEKVEELKNQIAKAKKSRGILRGSGYDS